MASVPGDDATPSDKTLIDGGGPVGAVFSGCLIERKLGQGGMGSVYIAKRQSDDARVVVKFLAPEQAANPTWRARFVREAQLMQRVAHPNIVGVYSVSADGDSPHIVMELVEGKGLDAVVKQGRLLPLEAARIARDIALALSEAHKNGVIHRDIKPANVLLASGSPPRVKVLDFGLAKNVSAVADEGLSMPGQILGTPHYMAPEQWGEHQVDSRCDIYALGITLFELATGSLPFYGPSNVALMKKVAEGKLPSPKKLAPEIPADLELVIYQMTMVDRRFRYATVEQAAADLDRVIRGEPVDIPRLVKKPDGARVPLLPATSFTLGRDPTCEIEVLDRSISRQHARIERTASGYVLHDLGSTYGSFVGGMRVKDVVLKDSDEIKLGKVAFEFKDGGLARLATSTRRITPDRMQIATYAPPVVQALVDAADRRVVLVIMEHLARDYPDAAVAAARARVRAILGGDASEAVGAKLEARLRRLRATAPSFLFAITHENLGDDQEAWLSWWDSTRSNYPAQVGAQQWTPNARFRVVKGEPEPRTVALDGSALFMLGRDENIKVPLNNASVSRQHACIVRLPSRLAIRDEGSRFGTLVNGAAVRNSFLCPNDKIVLGKVELVFETEPQPVSAEDDVHAIDGETWQVLEEIAHPSVALALVRFSELEESGQTWLEPIATKLFEDAAKRAAFVTSVRRTFTRRAQRAREVLPKLIGVAPTATAAECRAAFEAKDESLPPQAIPEGWFPG